MMRIMQSKHALLAAVAMLSMGGICRAEPGDDGDFSLADLADLDVSDIKEIRFETHPQGVYEFEVVNSSLVEDTDGNAAKRFCAVVECKIIAVKAVLEPGVDKEALVGKTQTEKMFIKPGAEPKKVQEAIGRIRAFVSDAGMVSTGKLGNIVANLKGHRFTGKIAHQKDQNDKSVVYARIKLDAKKA